MKRPAWAEAGTFARAWASIESRSSLLSMDDAAPILRALSVARVITVAPEQVDAIPDYETYDDAAAIGSGLDLPFDPVFLSLGGARAVGYVEGDGRVAGVLLARDPRRHRMLAPLNDRRMPAPAGVMVALPFFHAPQAGNPVTAPGALAFPVREAGEGGGVYSFAAASWHPVGHPTHDISKTSAADGAAVAIKTLDWLLRSVNVEIVEAPLTPKQRKREQAKGRQIALTVCVKAPKTRTAGRGGKVNYSHRFEVAGHYIHHFETKADGSQNAVFARCTAKDLGKVIEVDGKRCVRFWQPPHVKGPDGAPLVPKVRVVT